MTFWRNGGSSVSAESNISSLSSYSRSHRPSLLINRYFSLSSERSTVSPTSSVSSFTQRSQIDELFQLNLIAENGSCSSPCQRNFQPFFRHAFDVFLENLSFANSKIEHNVEQNGNLTMECDDFPINDCFALLDLGVLPSKPLHKNNEMRELQKKFLNCAYTKNGGLHEGGMCHCLNCKER